jgi:hypothetical protein
VWLHIGCTATDLSTLLLQIQDAEGELMPSWNKAEAGEAGSHACDTASLRAREAVPGKETTMHDELNKFAAMSTSN